MNRSAVATIILITLLFFAGFTAAAELVNLNKASASAIQQNLVGIGPIKAEAIISYRKKNGKFKNLDDLQNVTGIGPALIKKNKRYLSLTKGVVSGDDKAYTVAKNQARKSKATSKSKKSEKTAKSVEKKAKDKSKDKVKDKTTPKSSKKTSKSKKAKTKAKSKKSATTSKSKKDKSAKKKSTKKKKKKKTSKSTT